MTTFPVPEDAHSRNERLGSLLKGALDQNLRGGDPVVPCPDGLDLVIRRARARRSATFGALASVLVLLLVIPIVATAVRTGDGSPVNLASNPPGPGSTSGTTAVDCAALVRSVTDEIVSLRQKQNPPTSQDRFDQIDAAPERDGVLPAECCPSEPALNVEQHIMALREQQAQQQQNYQKAIEMTDADPSNKEDYRAQKDRAIAKYNELQNELEGILQRVQALCSADLAVPGSTGTGPTPTTPDTGQSGTTANPVPTTPTTTSSAAPSSAVTPPPTAPPTTNGDVSTTVTPTVPTTTTEVVNCGRISPSGWPTTTAPRGQVPCLLDAFARGQRATLTVRTYEPPNNIPVGTDPEYPMDWTYEVTGAGVVHVVEDARRSGQRPQGLTTMICRRLSEVNGTPWLAYADCTVP